MLDFLIVGAGLYGAVISRELMNRGKTCLILEKRLHIGGNCYTEKREGINVHKYGPHIFHTNHEKIWQYVNKYCDFNNFLYSPKAYYQGKYYTLPINLNTIRELNTQFPKKQINGDNVEAFCIGRLGLDIYKTIIYGYTKKQWQTEPRNVDSATVKRLSVKSNYNNQYFDDKYQGIPIGGYSKLIKNIIGDIPVICDIDYLAHKYEWNNKAKRIIYTGKIDEFYDYCFGELEYRTQEFKEYILPVKNFQNNAVINYTDERIPYTRLIEHKHFEFGTQDYTVVSKETPVKWNRNRIPMYPINNTKNNLLYNKYINIPNKKVIFGGRLGDYKYYDMHHVIALAIKKATVLSLNF